MALENGRVFVMDFKFAEFRRGGCSDEEWDEEVECNWEQAWAEQLFSRKKFIENPRHRWSDDEGLILMSSNPRYRGLYRPSDPPTITRKEQVCALQEQYQNGACSFIFQGSATKF
jgi:hypothetical protein